MENNRCVICQKDIVGSKKASKVIHIGLEHKKIFDILDEEFGKNRCLKHDSSTPVTPSPLASQEDQDGATAAIPPFRAQGDRAQDRC